MEDSHNNVLYKVIHRSVVLKDNSTMDKTEVQIVCYGILYLNLSSHQCQPSYKKYIAVL